MADHQDYFQYLQGRGRLGLIYRKHLLYPRLCMHLKGRTLDIGCGIGDMVQFRPDTVGVDINPEVVKWCASQGLPVHLMACDQLPFQDHTFDSVLMDNVLEHIAHPAPLLREASRILRPGGRLVVGVPGIKGYRADPDHKVFYDEQALNDVVRIEGFHPMSLFATPLKSNWLNQRMRQYCIYGVFQRG